MHIVDVKQLRFAYYERKTFAVPMNFVTLQPTCSALENNESALENNENASENAGNAMENR